MKKSKKTNGTSNGNGSARHEETLEASAIFDEGDEATAFDALEGSEPVDPTQTAAPEAPAEAPKRTRYLKHELTVEEARTLAARLAKNFEVIETTEDELGRVTAQVKSLKGRIDGIHGENRTISRTMREGYDHRNVVCVERRNELTLEVETIREDTGEVIEARPMTDKERQGELFGALDIQAAAVAVAALSAASATSTSSDFALSPSA